MSEKRGAGDGVVVAMGVCTPAQLGSSPRTDASWGFGEAHARKICKAMDLAERVGAPLVGLIDSGGARIQEGVASLAGYGEIFRRNVRLSGKVPQISVIPGRADKCCPLRRMITDFILLSEADSLMFVTGPKVVKQATFEVIDAPSLGGPRVHAEKSGGPLRRPTRPAPSKPRVLSSPLPRARRCAVPLRAEPHPARARPQRRAEAVRREAGRARRRGRGELPRSAGRLRKEHRRPGFTEGDEAIVINQPRERAGTLDVNASRKAARFVRTMSAFGIPLVTLVDVPGFMPGSAQEHGGTITHGAKLLYAYCEARVPRITVVLRKAFGGAYIVMASAIRN